MTFTPTALSWLLLTQLLIAFAVLLIPQHERLRKGLWWMIIPLACFTLLTRWLTVGYPPMRNVFEAFLWIPLLLVTTTALTQWKAHYSTARLDALVGALFLFPAIFVLSHEVKPLMPALQSPFFVPHILGYMIAYTLLTRAFFLSLVASHHARVKHFNARAAQMAVTLSFLWGFFFLTLALALGSIWGNEVWGAYWQWDPKEQWSLATWLVYVAALHFPEYHRGRRLLLGLGLLFIFLTLTWSNVIPNCLEALGMPSQWLTLLFPGGMHAYAR